VWAVPSLGQAEGPRQGLSQSRSMPPGTQCAPSACWANGWARRCAPSLRRSTDTRAASGAPAGRAGSVTGGSPAAPGGLAQGLRARAPAGRAGPGRRRGGRAADLHRRRPHRRGRLPRAARAARGRRRHPGLVQGARSGAMQLVLACVARGRQVAARLHVAAHRGALSGAARSRPMSPCATAVSG
jgi:hypothetical protein